MGYPTLPLLHTCEQLFTCVDVKLAIHRFRVRLSGILAHAELTCDGRDGAATNEFGEHVTLPSRQAITLPDTGLMTNGIYDGEGQQMELWVCVAGQDTDFYKSPEKLIGITDGPFYGCSYKPMLLVVLGGTRTNIDLQALDANDEPIPGLFNVGTMIGDFYSGVHTFAFPRHMGGIVKNVRNPPAKSARTNSGPQGQSQRHKAPPGSSGRTGASHSH